MPRTLKLKIVVHQNGKYICTHGATSMHTMALELESLQKQLKALQDQALVTKITEHLLGLDILHSPNNTLASSIMAIVQEHLKTWEPT